MRFEFRDVFRQAGLESRKSKRQRGGRDRDWKVTFEKLEQRQVLNGLPIANPDPQYLTPVNTQLVVPFA